MNHVYYEAVKEFWLMQIEIRYLQHIIRNDMRLITLVCMKTQSNYNSYIHLGVEMGPTALENHLVEFRKDNIL